jgi:transcriptional regulator with XRE-family HTH domain
MSFTGTLEQGSLDRIGSFLTLGQAIRGLREQRTDLSARALSATCGLSPSYVSKVEAGVIDPSFRAFAKLSLALGMTTAEMTFLLCMEANR